MASSALLQQIQAGKKLKKAEMNDRSAPALDTPKGGGGGGRGAISTGNSGSPSPMGGGAPQLAGLFAGGMPKLKPAGQNSPAKAPSLGKPPSIPKRDVLSPVPPPRPVPVPATPKPPARPTPTLPARSVPTPPRRVPSPPSSAPPPPRRVPSPPTSTRPPPRLPPATPSPAPPARPTPSLPPRMASPSARPLSIARPPPAIPPRGSSQLAQSPTRHVPVPPTLPGRAPPPPPPRPSSTGPPTTFGRVAPPPPSRRPPPAVGHTPPTRVRAVSEAVHQPPTLPPSRPASLVPLATRVRTTSAGGAPSGGLTNGSTLTTRKIPSPPASAGSHTFPIHDFPPPRPFQPSVKHGGLSEFSF
ncbi:uncharacterized protein BT62DRAFT_917786 [Guyanagaster necrorhizus]|uniref:WH2 domain-containing protein n=1 Tax=Guyanagaster necrorhizus TaxID=856835 RepID=A0A9P7VZA2_9AGAR|nr:uncharacterized protein BT62DRAFT_917786 [Guyanagaster necrorhizus MCA 3950]KAG7449160.1 hypothetical protein BT62DRAFT_917786 [Guyanagaster necrorhizus MCA 3950]